MPDAFALAAQSNVPLSSVRTSNPALISGTVGAAGIYVDGQPGSSYCVSSASGCSCNVSAGFVTAAGTITANNYVCVRHVASAALNQLTTTDLHVGGAKASFLVTTGTLVGGGPCTLDVDGNNAIDALTDGLLILRAMFGLTGTSVTNGALGGGASRSDWTTIRAYLNGSCGASFAP